MVRRATLSYSPENRHEGRSAVTCWLTWASVLAIYLLLSSTDAPLRAQDADDFDALNRQARELRSASKFDEAKKVGERVLALAESRFGPDDPKVASALEFLGDIAEPNAFRHVQSLYARALAIREKALGPEHPDVAKSLSCLAYLYAGQHILDEAVRLRDRSVAIYTKMLDDLERQVGSQVAAGQFDEALDVAARAIADQKDGFVRADMGKSCGPDN